MFSQRDNNICFNFRCSQLETVINDVMSEKESGGKELEELKERYCKLKETLATNSDGKKTWIHFLHFL